MTNESPALSGAPEISVVIPLYNEVENLEDLYRELKQALDPIGRSYEVILVDDGSKDGTGKRAQELLKSEPAFRVLKLRRNFGQTAAFSAGFDHARGRVVVTADGDLQNDPADIGALVARLDEGEGYDIICGWRKNRQDPVSKKIPSFFANHLISWATGVEIHDYGCSLKAIRADVVKGIRLYGEMHRFIPAVAASMGVRVAEVVVNHRPRTRGVSKYGIGRTTRVLLDLFTVKFFMTYGTRPAHLFGLFGLLFATAGFGILSYLTFIKFFADEAIGARPLLFFGGLSFLTGILLVNFGLMAELLMRTYYESQNKPIYVLKTDDR